MISGSGEGMTTKKNEPAKEPSRPQAGSLLGSMLSGPSPGSQPPSDESTRFMYRAGIGGKDGKDGDKGLTLRTRLIRQDINSIHRAIMADRTLKYPGRSFFGLEEAAFLMMELLVSEDGKGRFEYVQMMQSRTTANIDVHETPHRDSSLD